ncbi:gastrula zinc finger protein XlCGF26.1 [Patella vulgata]|uniref:gastrula zinc finger protein XlCGF26.1 n=1 Tax=Patella vulgata TaxID=6465 RepID=UPI0024A86B0E|nr:gastrula zinc finger protein XlCGF26.1 [Patella vulgata]
MDRESCDDRKKSKHDVVSLSKFTTQITQYVANLFDKAKYSDIQIILRDGHQINGHKLVLSAQGDNWGVADLHLVDELDLTDLEYEVGYTMIKWLYTDEVDKSLNIEDQERFTIELMKQASRFKLHDLYKRCEEDLISCLTSENSQTFYQLAAELSAQKLKYSCLQILSSTKEDENEREEITPVKMVATQLDDSPETGTYTEKQKHFSCNICLKSFGYQRLLKLHVKRHSAVKPFRCELCPETFLFSSHLTEHVLMHKGEASCECSICKRIFYCKERLRSHFRMHRQCKKCLQTFTTETKLREHRENCVVETKEQSLFECFICNKSFESKVRLSSHSRSHKPRTIPCDVCPKSFSSKRNLKMHRMRHSASALTKVKCDICGLLVRPLKMKRHLEAHDRGEALTCLYCKKCFVDGKTREKHEMTHINSQIEEKRYKCELCNRMFATISNVTRHKKIHTGEKSFLCNICGEGFGQYSQLQVHNRIHTGERPFACKICYKTFTSNYVLQNHYRIHSNDRPHTCDVCGLSFKSPFNFKRHSQKHTNPRPYKCSVCGKDYTKKYILKNHSCRPKH